MHAAAFIEKDYWVLYPVNMSLFFFILFSDALIEAIKNDISIARERLQSEEMLEFKTNNFFSDQAVLNGSSRL